MKKIRPIAVIAIMLVIMIGSSVFASAASDPYITIVNPGKNSTVMANSLLISIKVTQPRNLKIYLYQEGATNRVVKMTDTFKSTNDLSFYTKKLTALNPGAYRVHVETLNDNGVVVFNTDQYVALKAKSTDTSEVTVFQNTPGSKNLIQRMLSYVFGN